MKWIEGLKEYHKTKKYKNWVVPKKGTHSYKTYFAYVCTVTQAPDFAETANLIQVNIDQKIRSGSRSCETRICDLGQGWAILVSCPIEPSSYSVSEFFWILFAPDTCQSILQSASTHCITIWILCQDCRDESALLYPQVLLCVNTNAIFVTMS